MMHSIWVSNKCVFILLFTLLFLLGCSCTPIIPPDVQGIKPIWGTKLNNEAGIYNDGLIGLPMYDGKIIFHSTYFSGLINDAFEEDNRIHALDMETGKIQWTYPATYNKNKPMLFSGVAYQYNEYVVTKMRKQGSIETDKLVGLNLKTGQELWYKVIPATNSYNIRPDVVGIDDDFFYFEQTDKNAILCKGDIHTGQTNSVLEIKSEQGYYFNYGTSNVLYQSDKKLIIMGAKERNSLSTDDPLKDSYIYIIDITNNYSLKKVLLETNLGGDKDMSITHIYCNEDKIYATCGLTTICYNLNLNIIEWTYKSTESYNYMTNHVVVNDSIVFLYGDNRYVGLNAETGDKLYQGDIQCGNANAFNGYVYVIGRDGYLYILDIKTGKTLHRITCPERALPYPKWGGDFFTACKPQVYGDKLYVFSCTSAYCYDAVPKEEE